MAHDLGAVLTFCGISGVVFGAVYGTFFGYEIGGESAPFFRPMEDPQLILLIAVGFGVAVISVGVILNIVNCLLSRRVADGLLDKFGLVSGVFYWGALGLAAWGLAGGKVGLAPAVLLIGGPLVILFLRRPAGMVASALRARQEVGAQESGREEHEGPVIVVIESAVEVFETVLMYLTNTLSFARIGAFALAHAGLSFAIYELMHLAAGAPGGQVWAALIFVFGMLVTILLEGFIVMVQALRLEYYEFFNKFFRGQGRRFEPFDLRLAGGDNAEVRSGKV